MYKQNKKKKSSQRQIVLPRSKKLFAPPHTQETSKVAQERLEGPGAALSASLPAPRRRRARAAAEGRSDGSSAQASPMAAANTGDTLRGIFARYPLTMRVTISTGVLPRCGRFRVATSHSVTPRLNEGQGGENKENTT